MAPRTPQVLPAGLLFHAQRPTADAAVDVRFPANPDWRVFGEQDNSAV